MEGTRAIDCMVNVNFGDYSGVEPFQRVSRDYFKRTENFFENAEVGALLDEMDRLGVERAIVSITAHEPDPKVLEFPKVHPDRFALAVYLDPRLGMTAVRELEGFVRNEPVVSARVVPFMCNLPPNDRAYYPLYAKTIELDLTFAVNTGIPGPPAPARCQDPLHLDEVMLFFPDLKMVMAHGADPWWNVAIRLMLKYPTLWLMTSAYAPKYLPPELIHYMNTRGQDKILFASDHPVLPLSRCLEEARQLDLRPGVLDKFLYQNAEQAFFSSSKTSG